MILVDSNVILDILTDDLQWGSWSTQILETQQDTLAINPVIYAEISVKMISLEELDQALSIFKRLHLPYEAGFLAGKAFMQYKKKTGNKISPLPDFYIGAHAAVLGIPLITRDVARYKTYFPTITLMTPKTLC